MTKRAQKDESDEIPRVTKAIHIGSTDRNDNDRPDGQSVRVDQKRLKKNLQKKGDKS